VVVTPADRGFMHADVLGDVPQNIGLRCAMPFSKKPALEAQDALHDPINRFLALMNALDQPGGRTHFIVDVSPQASRRFAGPADDV